MDYKEAMEMVSTVMQKNGHSHLSNLCGVDPYLTKNSRTEEIRLLKEKVNQSVMLEYNQWVLAEGERSGAEKLEG